MPSWAKVKKGKTGINLEHLPNEPVRRIVGTPKHMWSGKMQMGPRYAVGNLIAMNFLYFGIYSMSTGPTKNTLRRTFGMQPESLRSSMVLTANFMNTSIVPTLVNSVLLWKTADAYS